MLGKGVTRRFGSLDQGFLAGVFPAGHDGLAHPCHREPAGASFVTVEPAPMFAPSPTTSGATSSTPEPTKARSPITVRCLFAPS